MVAHWCLYKEKTLQLGFVISSLANSQLGVSTDEILNTEIERNSNEKMPCVYFVMAECEYLLLLTSKPVNFPVQPQLRRIVQETDMPEKCYRQTFMFSATFPHGFQIQTLA